MQAEPEELFLPARTRVDVAYHKPSRAKTTIDSAYKMTSPERFDAARNERTINVRPAEVSP